MSYYRLLGLEKEPFSTSPDPDFFYLSRVHRATMFRLRTCIELKRGLSLVAGDIGTGKTTLARRMSQIFYEDPRIDFHVILNPMHHGDGDFLISLLNTFRVKKNPGLNNSVDWLQAMEQYLYQQGVEEKKTVILLIDEAQQLSTQALEVLRALLNYETNEHKLLQVILFGQMELVPKLQAVANFWDRISLKTCITAMDEKTTYEMIDYRLQKAHFSGQEPLFTREAVREIYKRTKGLPRRITMLCHDALEHLVMTGQSQVSRKIVRTLSRREQDISTGALIGSY